jgi:hypothetical protein
MALASLRAQQIMLGVLPEERRQSRAKLAVSAEVSRISGEESVRTAHVRDINILGAFFYCALELRVGEAIRLDITSSHLDPQLTISCAARIVRVETSAIHGVSGFAAEFCHFMAHETSASVEARRDRSFISWSVSMVEQMFNTRPELAMCAARIQGAA